MALSAAELFRFMSAHRLGVVGSLSPEGVPQSALVGIGVTEDLEIVFDTLSSTRKYRNICSQAKVCLVIGWDGEQTVQLEGDAFLPSGEALARYQRAYFKSWPDGPARQHWPGMTYVVVRPRWIRYSDYDQSPPCIEEFLLEEAGGSYASSR